MKIKTRAIDVFLLIYMITMLAGTIEATTVVKLFHNFCSALALFILVIKHYRPTKFMIFVGLYHLLLILSTYLAGNLTINLAVNFIKVAVFLSFIEMQLKNNKIFSVNTLFFVVMILTIINTMLVLFFPSGFWQFDVNLNEWTSVTRGQWILGNVNSMVGWYILLLLLWYIRIDWKGYNKLQSTALCLFAIISMLHVSSSTSIVSIFIASLAIWFGRPGFRPKLQKVFSLNTVYIVYTIATLLIIGGTTLFNPIISAFFKGNSTFSERTIIWSMVVPLILSKPIFGSGYIQGQNSAMILGKGNYTSAHNQFLNSAWQGGFVMLGILISIFLCVSSSIQRISEKKDQLVISLFVITVLIEGMFESALTRNDMWIVLLLCNIYSLLKSEEQSNGYF